MGQRFDRRGKRTDEMLELMRALWEPGWTEFDGEFYSTPRLEMEPTPPHIPIYVGGLSDIALRRAARNDGWIGDLITTDRAIASVERLRELRAEKGLSMDDFEILTPLTDAFTPEHYERAEAAASPESSRCRGCSTPAPTRRSAEKIDGMSGSARTSRWTINGGSGHVEPTAQAGRRRGSARRQPCRHAAVVRRRPHRDRRLAAGRRQDAARAGRREQQEREAEHDGQLAAIAAHRGSNGQKLADCRRPSAAASADRSTRTPSRRMR